MKRALLAAFAAAILTCTFPLQPSFAADEPETEISQSMEKISSAFRRVRRMVKSAESNAETLELLATMRTEAIAARQHTPLLAAEIPEAARAKFVEDFGKRMTEFIGMIEKTEAALKANDNGTAATLVSELAGLQKAAHKDFRKDDKKG